MTSLATVANGKVSADELCNAAVNLAGIVATGLALYSVINVMSPTPSVFNGGLFTEAPIARTR